MEPDVKRRVRSQVKAKLAEIAAEEAADKSRRACALLTGLEEFRSAGVVMLYMPIPGELDCLPAVRAAWQQGKTVLVPKVDIGRRSMTAVRCASAEDEMVTSSYGIREPVRDEAWPTESIDLIVAPALAYDRRGNRLGRGGGFYDRFLGRTREALACGLAFDEQVLADVPLSSNDWPVNLLVTDKEVLRFAREGRRALETPGETA